jgi:phosphohistidine phosphatase SixA
MRRLEVRRHALRDPEADRLSQQGRRQAEEVGREYGFPSYDVVFVSPAERTAETVAWFLRGASIQLPASHEVVPGLAGRDATGGSPEGMAAGFRALLGRVPEGGIGLAISHHPLIGRGVEGLSGAAPRPFAECEGVLLTLDGSTLSIVELRPGPARP